MKWRKLGLVLAPEPRRAWMQTHAMVPLPDHLDGDRYRVYFTGRDRDNRSHIGWAEVEVSQTPKVLALAEQPALSPGELGCFDDSGVTPSWLVERDGVKYLYYIGWQPRSRVRMGLMVGLALSRDGGATFQRYSRAPLLERTDQEPFSLLTAPCVMLDDGVWRMWYVSGNVWVTPDEPRYNVKYAESDDGIIWRRTGHVCIDFAAPDETALARPCVIKEDGKYRMWYAYKRQTYRIGYAESTDGLNWQRRDAEAGIDVSADGWDSEMIEYAYVFKHGNARYMLYNGNDYGRGGFGLAIAE